jgi:hypothetical protein
MKGKKEENKIRMKQKKLETIRKKNNIPST